jgi:hypothetical protein
MVGGGKIVEVEESPVLLDQGGGGTNVDAPPPLQRQCESTASIGPDARDIHHSRLKRLEESATFGQSVEGVASVRLPRLPIESLVGRSRVAVDVVSTQERSRRRIQPEWNTARAVRPWEGASDSGGPLLRSYLDPIPGR